MNHFMTRYRKLPKGARFALKLAGGCLLFVTAPVWLPVCVVLWVACRTMLGLIQLWEDS